MKSVLCIFVAMEKKEDIHSKLVSWLSSLYLFITSWLINKYYFKYVTTDLASFHIGCVPSSFLNLVYPEIRVLLIMVEILGRNFDSVPL